MKEVANKIKAAVLFCIKWRYLIALIVFVLCVVLKIHGSSIAEYNDLFSGSESYNAEQIVAGDSRTIRSDEWLVHTPYYMSQSYNNFGKTSNMMSIEGQDMIIGYNAPVADITLLAKPFTWGYMLFGNEYGLSWYWCSKVILMLLLSFELCMIITQKNKKISLLGMLLITFAPLVQWWFVPHAADVFFWGMAVLVVAYHFFTAKNLVYKNLFTIIAPLAVITFIIALFPSLQLPVGLVIIALLVAFLIRDKKDITFKKIDIWRIVGMAGVVIGIVGYTIIDSKDAIMKLYNTIYPGKRVSLGGSGGFKSMFTDLTTFVLPYKNITYLNNCEVSNFIHFAPIFMMIYPVFLKKMKREKNMLVGNTLLISIIVMAAFMLVGFPELLARITFFSYINRMDLAYGFIATLFTVWGIDMVWRKKVLTKKQAILVVVIYAMCYVCFVGQNELSYLDWWQYGIIIIGLTILVYLMLIGRQKLFFIGMGMLIAISGMTINPISRGVSALFDHPLEEKIYEIAEGDREAYWVASGDIRLSSIGIANGARVINAVNFYPDFKKWELIDPEGERDEIYNRYAHIKIEMTNDETKFIPGPTADIFTLKLNYKDSLKWPIKYLVTAGKLEGEEKYYKQIYHDTEGEYYIYERMKEQ
ncbi:hypothetical protein IKD82_02205 [Candidatus Saccharibacteria bacterium]|nr:hypothetical protein [Candidatus Saccharibacteria bacterium]